MLENPDTAPIDQAWRALFSLIGQICADSTTIDQAAIDMAKAAGWNDEALYDAITVCALFQFYNTWIDATGVHDLPAAAYEAGGRRMAAGSYLPPSE